MNFALRLVNGRLPGVQTDLPALVAGVDRAHPELVLDRLFDVLVHGQASGSTRAVLEQPLGKPQTSRAPPTIQGWPRPTWRSSPRWCSARPNFRGDSRAGDAIDDAADVREVRRLRPRRSRQRAPLSPAHRRGRRRATKGARRRLPARGRGRTQHGHSPRRAGVLRPPSLHRPHAAARGGVSLRHRPRRVLRLTEPSRAGRGLNYDPLSRARGLGERLVERRGAWGLGGPFEAPHVQIAVWTKLLMMSSRSLCQGSGTRPFVRYANDTPESGSPQQ